MRQLLMMTAFLFLAACGQSEFCDLSSGDCSLNSVSRSLSAPDSVTYITQPDSRLPGYMEEGFILLDALFEFGSDQLTGEMEQILTDIGEYAQKLNLNLLQVNGHTDSDGTTVFNQDLSERRAANVVKYLVDNGYVEAKLTQSQGFGETNPIVPNDSDSNKSKNRRVEIFLDIK